MSSDRFFEKRVLVNNQHVILSVANSHKIISVLRKKPGDQVILFNNTKQEFSAKIIGIEKHKPAKNPLVTVKIIDQALRDLESPLKIHLVQSVTKSDKMSWVIQKAAELGVQQITPIITDRTIVKPHHISNKLDHWQEVACAACCQCGRTIMPILYPAVKFTEFIQHSSDKLLQGVPVILSPISNNPAVIGIEQQLSSIITKELQPNNIITLVGPEGGFTDQELQLALANKFMQLSLGARILRSETAAITLISILQAKYGDL